MIRFGFGLDFSAGSRRSAAENHAPSGILIAWEPGFEGGAVPNDSVAGAKIATLTLVDEDGDAADSWALQDSANDLVALDGADVEVGTIGVPGLHEFVVRGTDPDGLYTDDSFAVEVLPPVVNPPEEPPPDGEVVTDPPEVFPDPPVVIQVDEAVKVKGKKKSGSTGKFIYDLGAPSAANRYTIQYDPDFTLLANQGVTAMVGFGFKQGNNFHLVGLRGDGATGLNAGKVWGSNWNETSGFSTDDGGPVANGTQAGPNWLRITTSLDGSTYTLESSADGAIWVEEYTNSVPTPHDSATDYPSFGIAVFMDLADAGNFTVAISLWRTSLLERLALESSGDALLTESGGYLLLEGGAPTELVLFRKGPTAYDQGDVVSRSRFFARFGAAPYSYEVVAGALPSGMTLDENTGELSGLLSATGVASGMVRATDALGATADYNFAYTVV